LALVAGCAGKAAEPAASPQQRIVSLDYCADQYVLKLADRAQIAALSRDAHKEFSYMRAAVGDIAQVRDRAEDIIALRPDLVVRTYGGGPNIEATLARAGIKVHQIGYAETFDDVRAAVRDTARAFGQSARGEVVITEMNQNLSGPRGAVSPRALYVTPGGVTTGSGSLIDVMMREAGFTNFEIKAGWRSLPLERLAHDRPDIIVTAFFNQRHRQVDVWSPAQHPIIARAMRDVPVVSLDGAMVACAAWFIADGVQQLRTARARLGAAL
jgi:iron complex transport system substrate-binding protein